MKIDVGRIAILKLSVIVAFAGLLVLIAITGGRQKVDASAAGPLASYTDAPGEGNCTVCHGDFPVNSGGGSVAITGIPYSYFPGQQVPVTVTVTHTTTNAILFGFQMTAIDGLGRRAGTFSLPAQMPPKMQILNGDVGPNSRQYVEHTSDGLFTNGVFGSNTWNFTWTAPAQRVGKITFYASGNGADGFGSPSGDNIYTTSKASLGTPIFDFDGDAKTDLGIYRPAPGEWWYQRSTNGTVPAYQFGTSTDRIVPGDFTGDGKTDIAFFRASTGFWFVLRSEDSSFFSFPFGSNGDIPTPADYDGDGKTDPGVFRPSTATWFIQRSSDGGVTIQGFGLTGDKPVVADYDGDGKADIAIYRPGPGEWWIQRSSNGTVPAYQFGNSTDKPVQGDWTGDGKADIAFFRPSTGFWFVLRSEDTSFFSFPWGDSTDTPAPGDYDGDGKFDPAIFRPSTANWFIQRSTAGTLIQQFGLSTDTPVPSAFVP